MGTYFVALFYPDFVYIFFLLFINMSPQNPPQLDEISEIVSEGTISHGNSSERIGLPDGIVEDRFRVDRRKLEAMILGNVMYLFSF